MIALLRGRVAHIAEDSVVLDVNGVGYLVHCPARVLGRLPRNGDAVELRVVTQVREDAITLYGFLDASEQAWFRLLQGIQGVGARSALAILGVLGPDEIAQAVTAGDRTALTRAPGIGARIGTRIVSELKERVGGLPAVQPMVMAPGRSGGGDPGGDALSALVQLGYGRSEAYAAVAKVQERLGDAAKLDALIRDSLKELAR
ncbi:MAG: Holliday junction branch migration protein RuvA [Geminicoccaceae bacterium]|nr:Holliday junction branch migration protein RuvA [Geminicoccaceae bacterium]